MEPNFKKIFADAFGGELTALQLWALVKFAKRVRKYARNNSAFNNLANRAFPHASFRQVTKQKPNGETYPGLQINVKGQDTTEPDYE